MKRRELVLVSSWLFALACNSPSTSATEPAGADTPEPKTTLAHTVLPKDPRETKLAIGLGQLLATEHLRNQKIDDALSRRAFVEYIDRLDPGKWFLLAKHVEELERHADRMDDQIRKGDLVLARLGAGLLDERRNKVATLVAKRLQKPFDFTIDEQVETDADKLAYANTEHELAERWRQVLKRQVLQRVTRMAETAKALEASKQQLSSKESAKPPASPPAGNDATNHDATNHDATNNDATNNDATNNDAQSLETITKALAKIPATFEGREKKARDELAKSYAGRFSRLSKVEALEPVETFLNAMSSMFDPHTLYLAPAEKENFDIQMSGSLEGIGALLQEDDHYIRVSEIVPGGASWRQGKLKAGDLILAVAQQGEEPVDVADMRINPVVRMIRGPKGTVVTLTVKKPDDRIEVISITRDVVAVEASYARGAVLDLGPDHPEVGFIYLPSFYGNTRERPGLTPERNSTDDVRALLEAFQRRGLPGAIIDLRGNGGGLLDHARDIGGMFIKTGPIVQTRYSNGESQILIDKDERVAFTGQVVVLIDRFSASASEIVAGALQDYRRAVIVGTTTHGKGTVQVILDLGRMMRHSGESLGVVKLTIQQFFRINGESTQWRGVIPDIPLPDPAAHIESGERHLDNAIPWSAVDPLPYTAVVDTGWDRAKLAARSKERIARQPVFKALETQIALIKSMREDTKMSLHKDKWMAERDTERKRLEAADPKLDDSPDRFKAELLAIAKPPSNENASNQRIERWRKNLARDPWVEEALHVLSDMLTAP